MDRFEKLANSIDNLRKLGFNTIADELESTAGVTDWIKNKLKGKEPSVPGSNMPAKQPSQKKREEDKVLAEKQKEQKAVSYGLSRAKEQLKFFFPGAKDEQVERAMKHINFIDPIIKWHKGNNGANLEAMQEKINGIVVNEINKFKQRMDKKKTQTEKVQEMDQKIHNQQKRDQETINQLKNK